MQDNEVMQEIEIDFLKIVILSNKTRNEGDKK